MQSLRVATYASIALRPSPLRLAGAEIERPCLVVPYGTGTAEFFQIVVSRYQYIIERAMFDLDPYAEPRSLDDLLEQACSGMTLDERSPCGSPHISSSG
ncbi:hypothetical protein P3W85_43370 [Cupriavidus basilensis]|uniref:Uncharacterized protein n=1 Tax=Cupriavidus basilensis TaxID=68895 RepID=A0ABT6B4D4_9BURK|nr:hypothetical protein [Cupriavidus basilensis]MDF3839731.1 hypothetical protein [Cupriavidus basilensis]